MSMKQKRNSPFHVGDKVKFTLGRRELVGVIVEDHGAIGKQGYHLFRVEIPMDPLEPLSVVMPEEECQIVLESDRNGQTIDKDKIIEYLKYGLFSILRSNRSSGTNQPRVWLCFDNLGNVTHTFNQQRGLVGGESVPFQAHREDVIAAGKRAEVLKFLETFGLDHREAEQVVRFVGTSP